jgi:hypothetical protein
MLAYGSRISFVATHQYRVLYDIDFSTGEAVRIR